MRDHRKLRVNAVCAPAESCAENLPSRPIEELQYVSYCTGEMVLNEVDVFCCYILEFFIQIKFSPVQFWVSGTSLWPFSNFNLLTCWIWFVKLVFLISSSADMDFIHIYESYLMLLLPWWVTFVTSTVSMMFLWEHRRPETWLKG